MEVSQPWKTVALASVLEPFGKRLIKFAGHDIAVFKQGEQLFAFADSCPHSGASLCSGRLEDGHVRCPAHGLRFRVTDGLMAGSAPGSQATSMGVRTYRVRIVGEELQIQL